MLDGAVKLFLLLFFSLPVGLFAQSSPVLILTESDKMHMLGGHMSLLNDTDGELSIEDVIYRSEDFKLTAENEPNMGFTKEVYWVRFAARNESGHSDWILEHTYPPMDFIDLYMVVDGKVENTFNSGDSSSSKSSRAESKYGMWTIGSYLHAE